MSAPNLSHMSDAQLARFVQDAGDRLHKLTDDEREAAERAYEALEARRAYRPCASSRCPESATHHVQASLTEGDFCAAHTEPLRANILITITEIAR